MTASFTLETTAAVVHALLAISGVGVLCLLLRAFSSGAIWRSLVALMPSTLATVGVLGTFYGIWTGLQDFDVGAIDASVPALLEGLKLAFVTSLWGMALSVAFRVLTAIVPARAGGGNALDALARLLDEQQRTRTASEAGFESLRQAIAGEGDATLVAQISRLRTDLGDRLHQLEQGLGARHAEAQQTLVEQLSAVRSNAERHHEEHLGELRAFARHMVENTHKALIEALEDVIRDFNAQLTTQFGENFRELNAAVGRLLEWQERYRTHVEALEARIETALVGTERGAAALTEIERSAVALPAAVEPLAPVLDTIERTLGRVHEDLSAYADLHDKARAALPLVNENLEAMSEGLREAVGTMLERSEAALARQTRSHEALEAGYGDLSTKADAAQTSFASAVDATMERVHAALEKAAEQVAHDIAASLSRTDDQIKQQIEELDRRLGEELEKALGMMGNNLGSMSERFVSDYEPLTRELGEIVALARAANAPSRD